MKGTVVTSPSLKVAVDTLHTLDKGLGKEWRARAKREIAEPWAAELRTAAPSGSKGAAAARSIKAGSGRLPSIRAGVGSWNGWQPFFALEFGMSHEKVHTYVRKSKRGNSHFVRRRIGGWAPVHRGSYGYWFFPYWDAHSNRVRSRAVKLANGFIRRSL